MSAVRAARFTQSDLKRAVKGVSSAGFRVVRIEIDANGKIVMHSASATPATVTGSWDDVL